MSQNKFLKNLTQPGTDSRAVEPILPQAVPQLQAGPAATAAAEYDPIKRLTDELSRQSQVTAQLVDAVSQLIIRIDRLEQKPPAATQAQVKELAEQQRPIKLDAQKFAEYVQPALLAKIPPAETWQTAAQAGVSALTAAAVSTSEQILGSGQQAAREIRQATAGSRGQVLGWLGFQSWKHALLLAGIPLVLSGSACYGWYNEYQQRKASERQLGTWRDFGNWVHEKYPEVWKVYNK